jgi:hypothetical protein
VIVQAPTFELVTHRLGPLPLVNHFLDPLGLDALLDRFVPTTDGRCQLGYGKAIGVLVRSLRVEREPIYRHHETVRTFACEVFRLDPQEIVLLRDDHLGRSLDRLFDADRGTLMTELVVTMSRRFQVRLDELHNDSTTVRVTGQYRRATGRSIRGRRAPWITYGYSKDHRPDLKQLLVVLTSTRDEAIPVAFRSADGNTNDTTTHLETWEELCRATGRADFLDVADSKLCATEVMETIDRRGGRFITVLPRSRREDGLSPLAPEPPARLGARRRPAPPPAQASTARSLVGDAGPPSVHGGLAGGVGEELLAGAVPAPEPPGPTCGRDRGARGARPHRAGRPWAHAQDPRRDPGTQRCHRAPATGARVPGGGDPGRGRASVSPDHARPPGRHDPLPA